MPKYRFNYPEVFKTLPDYTAHAGQVVDVVRPLKPTHRHGDEGEYDFDGGEAMFLIRAADGWEGHAFRSELERVEEPENSGE